MLSRIPFSCLIRQTLLPQIRAEIREEFRTSSGPSDSGGNPPPVTIHTWLERFNKQKPRSFEKATAPVDVKNWISYMEKIFDVIGCEDAFKTRLVVYKFEDNALAWWKAYKEYHSIRQKNTETSTEFMQRFLRLAGFLGAAAAQVANAARNYEILYERDDDDAERPDKWQKSGDRHQPTTQQSSHKNHDHNNDCHGSNRRGGSDNHRNSNNNYFGNNNRNSDNGRDQRNRGQQSNRSVNSGVPLRATPTQSALRVDADTQESVVELLADKKPGALGRVFAISKDHATKTSGMDWLTEHHAMIDCRSYRVIFGDIHAPEFIYHGSLPRKSMQIIFALQACTLMSHGCEGFLATIYDTTSDVPSIHDQPIV
nr:hypothetical protein [Tanacetum cinerariifolium]